MKPTLLKTFSTCTALALLFLIQGCDRNGASSPEGLAQSAVHALAQKDKRAFQALLVDQEVMKQLLADAEMDAMRKENYQESLKDFDQRQQQELDTRWAYTYEVMEAADFDATKMAITQVDVTEEVEDGTLGADISVKVRSQDKQGMLEFLALKAGGWHLISTFSFEPVMP